MHVIFHDNVNTLTSFGFLQIEEKPRRGMSAAQGSRRGTSWPAMLWDRPGRKTGETFFTLLLMGCTTQDGARPCSTTLQYMHKSHCYTDGKQAVTLSVTAAMAPLQRLMDTFITWVREATLWDVTTACTTALD